MKKVMLPLVMALVVGVAVPGLIPSPAEAHGVDPPLQDGSSPVCGTWFIQLLDLGLFDISFERADEGWAWVDETRKMQNATGVATRSDIAVTDTGANHFSPDWGVGIRVDPGREPLLSDQNPTTIELEWETGIAPDEATGDGNPTRFPNWVKPNPGDRVWTNGHWVFDCGHGDPVATPIPVAGDPSSCPPGTTPSPVPPMGPPVACVDDHFRTEIHPGRALAAMRSQTLGLPGSGTTPVPVTATDLYIHGSGTDLLLHYETAMTGIDPGDVSACVIGETFDGIGIYGCGPVTAQ